MSFFLPGEHVTAGNLWDASPLSISGISPFQDIKKASPTGANVTSTKNSSLHGEQNIPFRLESQKLSNVFLIPPDTFSSERKPERCSFTVFALS